MFVKDVLERHFQFPARVIIIVVKTIFKGNTEGAIIGLISCSTEKGTGTSPASFAEAFVARVPCTSELFQIW